MRLNGVMSAADRDDLAEAPAAAVSLCVVVASRPPPTVLGECAIDGLVFLLDLEAYKQSWLCILIRSVCVACPRTEHHSRIYISGYFVSKKKLSPA